MSQINFFMTQDDERAFVEMLLSRSDTLLFSGRSFPTPSPEPVRHPRMIEAVEEVSLVNSQLMPEPRCSGRGRGEHKGKYLFEMYEDPFIEFQRCAWEQEILIPGRLHMQTVRSAPAASKTHERWYRSIRSWITKRYHRRRDIWWFAPGALAWSQAGGRIAYGSPAECVLVETLSQTNSRDAR